MTVRDLQKRYLTPASPHRVASGDFFVLLAHATGKERGFLLAHPEYSLDEIATQRFESYLQRRALCEPVAYIKGQKEFYGRRFMVSPHVLIPRPETEHLVEEVLQEARQLSSDKKISFIDVGTGSGAIIITLVKELEKKNISYYALDISPEALHVAETNAETLVAKNISFLQSNLLEAYWKKNISTDSLFIVANLPYLPLAMHANAPSDVKDYEPALALVSGADGLDHYRALINDLEAHAAQSFTLFLEIDPSQKNSLSRLLQSTWPQASLKIMADLSGKSRLLILQHA